MLLVLDTQAITWPWHCSEAQRLEQLSTHTHTRTLTGAHWMALAGHECSLRAEQQATAVDLGRSFLPCERLAKQHVPGAEPGVKRNPIAVIKRLSKVHILSKTNLMFVCLRGVQGLTHGK